MDDSVSDLIEINSPQSRILEAAEQSEEYVEVPGDDLYRVFRGPEYLIVGIRGEGVYTEELNKDLENGYRFTFIDQEPWKAARETTYRIDGYWKEIMDEVVDLLPEGSMITPMENWESIEDSLEQSQEEGYNLSGTTSPGEFQLHINDDNGEAMIEFNHDRLRVHEKGEVNIPDIEDIEGLKIDKIVSGTVKREQSPQTTL